MTAPPQPAPDRQGLDPLTVLLVEDNPGDARLIALMLAEVAAVTVRLERAERLAAALARLGAGGAALAAILLDLSLPDSQGLDTFTRIRGAAPDIPIVVLSGLADETLAMRAVHDGAQDYLVKGQVDGGTLLRALRYAIERQRAQSERRRLLAREQVARAAAERLAAERAAILGQIADGVIIADTTGSPTFANAAALRLLRGGIGPDESAWADAEGTALAAAALPLARAVRQGTAIIDGEWQITPPGGPPLTVQGSATPVRGADGQPLGAVFTFRDVTTRRAIEQEREEFFADAAHDLRTPLAAITAAIGVVLANEPPDTSPPLRRMFTNIDRAATGMGRLVDDLLELGRLQRGRAQIVPVPRDLRPIAAQAARAIEPLAGQRGQRLTVTLPPAPLLVRADAPRLEQAILNLLGNAQKYGREGGRIALRVERHHAEALVVVADDGPGIPLDEQARIFERFYRPEAASSRRIVGSGLGLPIVKLLTELHGGRVAVESQPGRGATFRIALPLAAEDVSAAEDAHTAAAEGG